MLKKIYTEIDSIGPVREARKNIPIATDGLESRDLRRNGTTVR